MTMLLIAEAVDSGEITLEDEVTASAGAASMGGSQVWLEEGEVMTVSDMLKCIAVASANDCAVAMAEYISGSEDAFVERMNARAAELGLEDTHFTNCTGLFDDDEHYTSAYDIAVMSRELMLHDWIKDYTTIWMDSIRDGEFGLSNTNKLVRHYEGCTGLKTGFTSEAMYCLSATAERDGMELIAVIMHSESIESRNRDASSLLNYGFAGFELCSLRPEGALPPVRVHPRRERQRPASLRGRRGPAPAQGHTHGRGAHRGARRQRPRAGFRRRQARDSHCGLLRRNARRAAHRGRLGRGPALLLGAACTAFGAACVLR